MNYRSALLKSAVVLLVVVLVGGMTVGVLGATGTLKAPTVGGIENDWGAVTDDAATIDTTVVVDNPNPVGVPGIVDVEYTASMNDVRLATGRKSGVGLSAGRNELRLATEVPHDRIAAWWVTHVNGNERSTLRIEPSMSLPGYSRDLPTQTTQFSTNLLGSFQQSGQRSISFQGEEMLMLSEQRAAWGTATAEETPIAFSTSVANRHDYEIAFDRIGYAITMGNVTVGNGTTEGFRVAPGDERRLEVDAAISTPKISTWWASHLRGNERSRMSVELYGVVDDGNGTDARVDLYSKTVRIDTDLLGGGGASVRALRTDADRPTFEPPSVERATSSWGDVTSSYSEIESTVHVHNPNAESSVGTLASVALTTETRINDVRVGEARRTIPSLRAGDNTVELASRLDNGKVPEWWAKHLNDGERSTLLTATDATVDLGFTKFDLDLGNRTRTFTTNVLSGMNDDSEQTVTVDGRDVLSVSETRANWGTATPEEAPLATTAVVTNERYAPVTVSEIDYTVRMNDVVLANETSPETYTIAPGDTADLDVTMRLDNRKMDEWWVSHLRDGERSQLSITAYATVTVRGQSERVPLEFLGQNETVTTDLLGGN